MKLEYSTPKIELVEFEMADILTLSYTEPETTTTSTETTTSSSGNSTGLQDDDIYNIT